MKKNKFLNLIFKSLGKKISDNSKFEIDSLNVLQIVEFNNVNFKGFKINPEQLLTCSSTKDLLKLYKDKVVL